MTTGRQRPTGTAPRVVVVGGGIVGASIAFHLSLRNAQVTLLEAGQPGQAASAVSFAWINGRDKKPRGYHDLNRRSLDMWSRFVRRTGAENSVRWGGELRWTANPESAGEFEARVQELQSWGYPIRLISPDEVVQIEPGLVTGPVASASYTDIDGHVDTASVINACLERAAEHGADIRTGSPATGLQRPNADSNVEAVTTPDDEIPCDAVVLANGVDVTGLAAGLGIEIPQLASPGVGVITEPVAPAFQNIAVLHTARDLPPEQLLNIRQMNDGSVMIHGNMHDEVAADALQQASEQVVRTAANFLPALNGARVSEVRRGFRPMPADGHPILGFAEAAPNVYFAVTHSGVTLAPLVGEFAATEIIDGARIDILAPYRVERFT
ncbi:MAG: FAD-dependent oxidoreductase [Dehalococcoidia bacterium]